MTKAASRSRRAGTTRGRGEVKRGFDVHEGYRCLQEGAFSTALLAEAEALKIKVATSRLDLQRRDDLTLINFIVECFDASGDNLDASMLIEPYRFELKEWAEGVAIGGGPTTRDGDSEAYKVPRSRIMVLVNYAHTLYRREEYDAALRILKLCEQCIKVFDGDQPGSPGTRWRIYYSLGQTYRQLNRYKESEDYFNRAVDFAARRMLAHAGSTNRADHDHHFRTGHWAISKCLVLGLGWLYYAQGDVERAMQMMIPGRALLLGTRDAARLAYADLLLASARRTQAGRSKRELHGDIIASLRAVYDRFGELKHPVYTARAAFELALAYLSAGDTVNARLYIAEVMAFAVEHNARRWSSLALTITSRIDRELGTLDAAQRALRSAQRAMEFAELSQQDTCRFEALIACGEAEFELARLGPEDLKDSALVRSEQYFERAAVLGQGNRKTEAACHLHLARVNIVKGVSTRAKEHWDRWLALRDRVAAQWIHDFAAETVSPLLETRRHLVIDAEKSLHYEFWRKRVQEFLLAIARDKAQDNARIAAQELGISRQTFYQWIDPKTPGTSD